MVVSQQRMPIQQAFTLLHPVDKRALFIFPWENRTVIGTTDLDHPPLGETEVSITNDEVDYLLLAANNLFENLNLTREDIISTWAGVRPLISAGGDGKRVSPSKEKRDHSVWLDNNLVTVSGGKLTTFRLIALDVLKTCKKVLPIDDIAAADEAVFSNPTPQNPKLAQLPEALQKRLQGFYGQQLDQLLDLAGDQELTHVAESNTLWAEVRFAAHYEQVNHLDDLLLRRTRLGLVLPNGAIIPEVVDKLKQICQQELGWDEDRWNQELQRYQQLWQRYYHLPSAA